MIRIPTHREPTHPGEMLLEEFLKPMHLSQRDLANGIHVPYQRVNELVNKRRGVTPATALRLGKFFGNSPAFWMNLQLRWELYHARQSEAEDLRRIRRVVQAVHAGPPATGQRLRFVVVLQLLVAVKQEILDDHVAGIVFIHDFEHGRSAVPVSGPHELPGHGKFALEVARDLDLGISAHRVGQPDCRIQDLLLAEQTAAQTQQSNKYDSPGENTSHGQLDSPS